MRIERHGACLGSVVILEVTAFDVMSSSMLGELNESLWGSIDGSCADFPWDALVVKRMESLSGIWTAR